MVKNKLPDLWVPILAYHSVTSFVEDVNITIPPQVFEHQLDYLKKRGYSTITLVQLEKAFSGEFKLPKRPLIITFDDGYEDNYQYAWPILKSKGFTAAIFLITDYIGKDYIIDQHSKQKIQLLKMLKKEQILEMSQAGIEFGSHSVNHRALTEITQFERTIELEQSKKDLSSLLGKEVKFFAYPFSQTNELCQSAVAEAGYSLALSGTGPYFTRFSLSRIDVSRAGTLMLRLKLLNPLSRFRKTVLYIKIRSFISFLKSRKPRRA